MAQTLRKVRERWGWDPEACSPPSPQPRKLGQGTLTVWAQHYEKCRLTFWLLMAFVEREGHDFERLGLAAEVDVQGRAGLGVGDVDVGHGHRVAQAG